MMQKLLGLVISTALFFPAQSQIISLSATKVVTAETVSEGAERMELYLPMLEGKQIGVVCNHTSLVGTTHLVDTLVALGVSVKKIFVPEHGFRGDADAGEKVASTTDEKTGIPVVSLYGAKKKPAAEDISDLDILLFDMQDVGTRFYTYISTMSYVMEAAAENSKQVIVLDRPNPNGHYIDGPVLKPAYSSFVGLHPVPVVHGCTIGEYACMVNGEKWLANGVTCSLTVIECLGWTHQDFYQVPVKPSPNLPNMEAIYLYPTLCFFEGTPMSVGRGTDKPFQVVGHPDITNAKYTFTPTSRAGAKSPKYEGEVCHGYDLSDFAREYIRDLGKIYVFWIQDMYVQYPDKANFFKSYFNTLAGTDSFQTMIKEGKTEEQIRESWATDLEAYKKIRSKYLLYDDFVH